MPPPTLLCTQPSISGCSNCESPADHILIGEINVTPPTLQLYKMDVNGDKYKINECKNVSDTVCNLQNNWQIIIKWKYTVK